MNSQYLRLGIPIALILVFVVILSSLISPITQQHNTKVKARHTLDTVFLPNQESIVLQTKYIQLEARLKNLKNGSACTGSNGYVCQKLKIHHNEQMRQVSIRIENKADELLIYQTKWNTTCQQWKDDSQKILAITANLATELKTNQISNYKMNYQKSQLQIQKRRRSTCPKKQDCPVCPEGDKVQCPDEVLCLQCEKKQCPQCQKCQECPHCNHHDYNQLKHKHDILTQRNEQCQKEEARYQQEYPKKVQLCTQIQAEVSQNLKDGLNILSKTLQKVSDVSTNLKQIIANAQNQVESSTSVENSLSVLPLILNGLTKELQYLDAKSKQEMNTDKECQNCGDGSSKILSECMAAFKKTIDKLTNCQTAISPFLAFNKQ